MKKHYLLGKLTTKKGEIGLLTILTTTSVIVFLILPVSAFLFEKLILEILYQEVEDSIELYAFRIIQSMDYNALSHQSIEVKAAFIEDFNEQLKSLKHPQLKTVSVEEFFVIEHQMTLKLHIVLTPTLYRDVMHIQTSHNFEYGFNIPIDS